MNRIWPATTARKRLLLTAVALSALLPVLSGAAAEKPDPSPVDDPALRQPLGLAERDAPISELLSRINRTVGVKLTADPSTADDKVTVFSRARPIGATLVTLARHLGFEWRKQRDGWLLRQNADAARQSADRLRVDREEGVRRLAGYLSRVAAAAQVPPGELAASTERLKSRLGDPGLSAAEKERVKNEFAASIEARVTSAPLAVRCLQAAGPDAWPRLSRGETLTYSTVDGTLSDAAAAEIWRGKTPPGEAPAGDRPARITIRLILDYLPVWLGDPATAHRDKLGFTFQAWSDETPDDWSTWVTLPPGALPLPSPPLSDPRLEGIVRVPTEPDPALPTSPFAWSTNTVPLSAIAEALHRGTGLDVVSDSYVRERIDAGALKEPQTASAILGTVTDRIHCDCKLQDGTLLLRSQVYYRDRPLQLPERTVRLFKDRFLRRRGATLDDLAQLAGSLTDDQIRGLFGFWGWYFGNDLADEHFIAEQVNRMRHDLWFWHGLTPGQRQAATSQKGMPIAGLSAAQRRAFLRTLGLGDRIQSLSPTDGHTIAGPSTVQLQEARFRMSMRERLIQQFRIDGVNPADLDLEIHPESGQSFFGVAIAQPKSRDVYTFEYWLGGRDAASRQVSLDLARPPTASRLDASPPK